MRAPVTSARVMWWGVQKAGHRLCRVDRWWSPYPEQGPIWIGSRSLSFPEFPAVTAQLQRLDAHLQGLYRLLPYGLTSRSSFGYVDSSDKVCVALCLV